jgi:hypothetical protein
MQKRVINIGVCALCFSLQLRDEQKVETGQSVRFHPCPWTRTQPQPRRRPPHAIARSGGSGESRYPGSTASASPFSARRSTLPMVRGPRVLHLRSQSACRTAFSVLLAPVRPSLPLGCPRSPARPLSPPAVAREAALAFLNADADGNGVLDWEEVCRRPPRWAAPAFGALWARSPADSPARTACLSPTRTCRPSCRTA